MTKMIICKCDNDKYFKDNDTNLCYKILKLKNESTINNFIEVDRINNKLKSLVFIEM